MGPLNVEPVRICSRVMRAAGAAVIGRWETAQVAMEMKTSVEWKESVVEFRSASFIGLCV